MRVVELTRTYQTVASASTLALHRLPTAFPAPDTFEPRRWLEPGSPQRLRAQEAAFMPFGYGARVCLGKTYAQLEVKLLVAALLLRYDVHLDDDDDEGLCRMTDANMQQAGTQDALPRGLRCDVGVRKLGDCGRENRDGFPIV